MGERGDRVRGNQHNRLPHRRFHQESRQGLPGGLEEAGTDHGAGCGKGQHIGPGGVNVRRRVRPGGSLQQVAEEEVGHLQEQHEAGADFQQRQQGVGLQRFRGMGHAVGARG